MLDFASSAFLENTEAIYVFSATDIYDAEEDSFKITLSDFIEQKGQEHLYYLTADGNNVFRKTENHFGTLVYEKEE